MIEVAEHLALIHHVSGALGVPYHLRDEAYSEGLVLLATAAPLYDPERGVPVGAYLAQRLRWGLVSWLRRELRHVTSQLDEERTYSPEEEWEARRMLDRVLYVAARVLNAPEYVSLLGAVYGCTQTELSGVLRKSGGQLAVLRESARLKIYHEMNVYFCQTVVAFCYELHYWGVPHRNASGHEMRLL